MDKDLDEKKTTAAAQPAEPEELHENEESAPAQEAAQEPQKAREEQLQEALHKKEEESKKNYDRYLRALAESENLRKRSQREKEEYIKFANVSLIKKLLPVIDDLNRAVDTAGKTDDFDGLHKGVEMIIKNLNEILKGEGIREIECVGKPFDPQYHQALAMEASDEYPENTVIEELQKGFIQHDRVIRPSLVKVSS